MRLLVAVGVFVCSVGPSVFAAEGTETQQARGGFVASGTAPVEVSGSAELVTGVALSCGATACQLGLYDDTGTNDDALADVDGRFEIPAAANAGAYVDLSDRPIRFRTGVMAVLQGSGNGAAIYTEQAQ